MRAGTVALVGAGPGDPGLLTLRAAELLAEADVVLVDRLVHPDVLRHCRPGTEVVDVGKTSWTGTAPRQDDINGQLVAHARAGRRVVRLKGNHSLRSDVQGLRAAVREFLARGHDGNDGDVD